jgi:hypothetical protein
LHPAGTLCIVNGDNGLDSEAAGLETRSEAAAARTLKFAKSDKLPYWCNRIVLEYFSFEVNMKYLGLAMSAALVTASTRRLLRPILQGP